MQYKAKRVEQLEWNNSAWLASLRKLSKYVRMILRTL